MKRFMALIVGIILCIFAFSLSGCSNTNFYKKEQNQKQLQEEIKSLQTECLDLIGQINELKDIKQRLMDNEEVSYVIELSISQIHYTLDVQEILKDPMNTIIIPIEVSQEYYYNVKVGQTLNDDLRVGSLIFEGSWENYNVVVSSKQIVTKKIDPN